MTIRLPTTALCLLMLLPTALLAQTNPCQGNGDYVRLYNQATAQYKKGQYTAAALNFDKAGRICPSCTDCQAQTAKANKAEQARIARKEEQSRVSAKAQAAREEQARVSAKTQADREEQARIEKKKADQEEQARTEKKKADQEEQGRIAKAAQEAKARIEKEKADQEEQARIEKDKADREGQARIEKDKADRETEARVVGKETGAVYVAGGTYEMGSNRGDANAQADEMVRGKKHRVAVGSFYMAKTEVTQAQWRAVMGRNPFELYNKGCDNCPVEGVSYEDVEAFLAKLNGQQSAHRYRLPTEAEWEYAARGGFHWADGYVYAGSNNIDEVAWYIGNYNDSKHGSQGSSHPVGTKRANQLGLYDLSGNVWEWCSDWYKGYLGSSGVSDNTNTHRVLRGGSWRNDSPSGRVVNRINGVSANRNFIVGFRWVFSQ